MSEFFHMGGYAAFVWPAYGVVFGLMIGLAALSLRRARRAQRRLEALQQDAPHRHGEER